MTKPDIHYLESCTSTNRLLLEALDRGDELPDGYTVYTSYQSRGYGQVGNSWEAEGGKNLLFSLLIHPTEVHALEQFFISEAIALAIAEYLDTEADSVSVKWPNDIYWKDKKICGILIENNLTGAYIKDCVIGVGLNLNQEVFHSDAPNPVSLKNITGKTYNIENVLSQILANFSRLLNLGYTNRNALHTKYIERLFRYNAPARYSDATGEFTGTITAVEQDGHLHIKNSDGCDRRYAFKEVSYIL